MAKKVENKLSAEQMKHIDSYGDNIKTIKEFVEAVRKRPGMYIGPRGSAGFLNMIREIFQNALDQLLAEHSPCTVVTVVCDMQNGGVITIKDDGMGIPLNDIVRIYTQGHTSKNFEKKPGDYSAGLNGIGAKATNALSEKFMVTSFNYKGFAKRVTFSKGKVVKEEDVPNKECNQGTIVTFTPDQTIMGNTTLDPVIVYSLMRDMVALIAIGSTVDFTSIDLHGNHYHEVMVNKHGITSILSNKCENMMIAPIMIEADTGYMKINAAFTFDMKNIDCENITSFANMCPTSTTPQNTHVKGFLDGVCSWFVKYMNNIYLGEKSKTKVTANDVKASLCAVISAFHIEPDFTGQAKEVFSNADYEPFAKQTVLQAVEDWSKNRPQDLQKLCKFLKEIADARIKAESEKVKITAKYEKNVMTGFPEKYTEPSGTENIELLIVEGDSAESSARDGRDVKTQGIFPIRGKILNVYGATLQKIQGNAEIMAIKDILNAGFGKTFDLSKVKFKKIIFMTDADADGDHIASLLLLLFVKFFPGLVESGMVYKAVPPLYGVRKGEKNVTFFTERVDFAKYMQKQFFQKHVVRDENGKALTPLKFTNILLNNEDYVYEINAIANRYKINPDLLEMILISSTKKESYAKMKKRITSTYRFMQDSNITKEGNTIKIKGLIGDSVQTVFFNDRFIHECSAILPFIEKAIQQNEYSFIMDDQPIYLYQLVKGAEDASNMGIERYKGLGEMSYTDLGNSTMLPENRKLMRYTTDNLVEDIKVIRTYESNKKLILDKIDAVKRIDLIG